MKQEQTNKLIAEFMGLDADTTGNYFVHLSRVGEEHLTHHMLLGYHTSWDWLMPVVVKCFDKQEEVSDDLSFKLNDALLETNIESLYNIVVEFINQLNNQ